MPRLDVQVLRTQRLDEHGDTVDVLQVVARNPEGRAVTLSGCVVILPLGMRVYSDPPQLAYPFRLEVGGQCTDAFECRKLAGECRDAGYPDAVTLCAMFVEPAPPWSGHLTMPQAEHRSDPFLFHAGRWPSSPTV